MPTIKTISSIKIQVFTNDHNPPHFHAEYAEHKELIVIATLETHRGQLPKKQRKLVIEWAEKNQDKLKAAWNILNPKKAFK